MTNIPCRITGIGNAIVDVLARVEESFLQQHRMEKGSMQLVGAERIAGLHAECTESRQCSGGSVANSIAALAQMGLPVRFIGRVADDAWGEAFTQDIRMAGVLFDNKPADGGFPTACCMVCVTPDGERTMNTYIGASAELAPSDIDEDMIAGSDILYIEGYLWDKEPAKQGIRHAVAIARKHGVKTAFSLSDAFCVDRHRAEFVDLINDHVDMVFANEDEALSLYQVATVEEAAIRLQQQLDSFAITCSDRPAIIWHQGELVKVAPAPVASVVDATGAGDLFAAGFLYGMLHHYHGRACAELGHRMAGHIIQQLGARSQTPLLPLMDKKVA